jgi:hypothetical protein
MKRTILLCIVGITCLPFAHAQISFDESGLSDNLPYPAWTTPTPACYDLTTEYHYNLEMRDCNCGCTSGFSYSSTSTRYSTRGGVVEILYPPFADRTISFTKNRDGWSIWDKCPTRTASTTWHGLNLRIRYVGGVGEPTDDNDDFVGLNHLRYSSYLFDENGADQTGITSACPFGTQESWANERLCAAAKRVRFNRLPIIANELEKSDHVQTNVVKQVYYCDVDRDDRSLKTWVGNGDVRTYCFAPKGAGYWAHGEFSTDDRNMDGAYNVVAGNYSAYEKQPGTNDGSTYNYKFKVSDWRSLAANVNSVTVRANDASEIPHSENVRKLNNGIEVYIMVLAGEEVEYAAQRNDQIGGKVKFYGKPRLIRTHVYPTKPKWRKERFRN